MELWCLFIVFLILTILPSSIYSDDSHHESNLSENLAKIPSNARSSSLMQHDRSIVKRSQRNANVLYRYCRHSGQAPNFCLKYAVRMVLATGH